MAGRNLLTNICLMTTAATAIGLSYSHPASAQTVYNVQFNSLGGDYYEYGASDPQYTGASEQGVGGDTWNYLNVDYGNTTVTNLVDSNNGPASTVGLTFSEDGAYSGDVNSYVATPSSPSSLLSQYALVNGGDTGTFSTAGLTTGTNYDLVLYSGNGAYNNSNTTFTVANGTAVGSPTATASGATEGDTTFVAGGNYTEFSGTTDASGTITGTYFGATGGEGDWDGFSLELLPNAAPTPESSTSNMLLIGLSMLGASFLVTSRRKRANN